MLARLRHAGRIERQQIKWFAYATAAAISGVILKNTIYPAVGVIWVWWVGLILTTVGVVSSPVAMGRAILFYRLAQATAPFASLGSTFVVANRELLGEEGR